MSRTTARRNQTLLLKRIAPALRTAWFLGLVVLASCTGSRCGGGQSDPLKPSTGTTYVTGFALTENPISEAGKWVNGKQTGIDWSDVATVPGLAYGSETGTATGIQKFDDSTALLSGSWGSDQGAEATVRSVNQNDAISEEVELRLRSSITAHRNTGYEINFRCSKTDKAYMEIVRWNGSVGDFTYLLHKDGSQYGVTTGDVVKATIIGNMITVYINGSQVAETTDNTFTTGNPGMGFYLLGTTGVNQDYGFSHFMATDKL
jgi:hypothetical protein